MRKFSILLLPVLSLSVGLVGCENEREIEREQPGILGEREIERETERDCAGLSEEECERRRGAVSREQEVEIDD